MLHQMAAPFSLGTTETARAYDHARRLPLNGNGGPRRRTHRPGHTFEAEVDSTYTAEFRPALRVEEFFRDLFALPTDERGNPRVGDAARLMRAYPDEFLYFPFIPVSVQRALAVPLSKLGSPPRRENPDVAS
jgi:hypothetical protein